MSDDDIFDPDFLSRLRVLFFRLRKRRKLQRRGVQPSPSAGFTREFKDHRQYTPGDDFRTIDWRLFARIERVFVRIFEEIQEFHVHIFLDTSVSMHTPFPHKRVMALRLTAALAYLGLVNQHRVSVYSLSGTVRREMPPLKGQGHIHALLNHLLSLRFGGTGDLDTCIKQIRSHPRQRGIVFVLSDFLGQRPDQAEAAVRATRHWPSETHLLHVLDQAEIEPELMGDMLLTDVETGERRRIMLSKREMVMYAQVFSDYLESLERLCIQRQINYARCLAGESFETAFVRLLTRDSALAASRR